MKYWSAFCHVACCMCMTCLVLKCDRFHSYVQHESCPRLTHLQGVPHFYVRPDKLVAWLIHTRVMTHICVMTLSYVCHGPATGWRRVIGCLIFIGHFPQKSLWLVALLRKMACYLKHLMNLRHHIYMWYMHAIQSLGLLRSGWVMTHISTSHVAYMNASCHTYKCVWLHIWMNRVSHESIQPDLLLPELLLCNMNRSQDLCICVTYPIHVCDMPAIYKCDKHAIQRLDLLLSVTHTFSLSLSPTHTHLLPNRLALVVRPDSFARVTWLIYMCALTRSYVCHDPFVKWFVHMCAMTRTYVCHDSFICVPWRIHIVSRLLRTCAMTHSHMCHDSRICVPWLIHMHAMTPSHMCHDSFACVPW